MLLNSYAKINLYLKIGKKLKSGYHNIQSVMQPVQLHDNISFDKLNKEQQKLVATFIYTYVNLFAEEQTEKPTFTDYSPPPLVRDVQVLDQTFLI